LEEKNIIKKYFISYKDIPNFNEELIGCTSGLSLINNILINKYEFKKQLLKNLYILTYEDENEPYNKKCSLKKDAKLYNFIKFNIINIFMNNNKFLIKNSDIEKNYKIKKIYDRKKFFKYNKFKKNIKSYGFFYIIKKKR
jgi:hypothetical protein